MTYSARPMPFCGAYPRAGTKCERNKYSSISHKIEEIGFVGRPQIRVTTQAANQLPIIMRLSTYLVSFLMGVCFVPSFSAADLITGFVLVNAYTDQDIGPLSNGGEAPANMKLSVRADTVAGVNKVEFKYQDVIHTENHAFWAMAGNIGPNYNPVSYLETPGEKNVNVTAYKDGISETMILQFWVGEAAPVAPSTLAPVPMPVAPVPAPVVAPISATVPAPVPSGTGDILDYTIGADGFIDTQTIETSSLGDLTISVSISHVGTLETSGSAMDYVQIYYKVDDDPEVLWVDIVGNQYSSPMQVTVASGSQLNIRIVGDTSADSEVYYVNLSVFVDDGAPVAPIPMPVAAPHPQSSEPSAQPSPTPTSEPSSEPTFMPSVKPSSQPSMMPSSKPSTVPSTEPSLAPSSEPTAQPSFNSTNSCSLPEVRDFLCNVTE
jgi:hypothetical protein